MIKRQPLKHNVIDRDKIVVPPNWDSWGKIRVLGGSFDTELVSNSWSEDFSNSDSIQWDTEQLDNKQKVNEEPDDSRKETSAIAQYEDWCRDPTSGGLAVVENAMHGENWVGVESEDTQDFLERQLKILEAFKTKTSEKGTENAITRATHHMNFDNEKSVSEHIGPVQFNMGGIQVDADDMLQRLKVRSTRTQR